MINGGLDNSRHPKWKTFLYYAAFICLMLAGFLMIFSMRSQSAKPVKEKESCALISMTSQSSM